MPEKKRRTGSRHRLVYTVAPLILLLGVLFVLNWLPRLFSSAAPTAITPTSPTPAASLVANTAVSTPIPLSPEPSATATTIPTPTLPPTATIRLLGPPPAATFALDTLVTFYWQWRPVLAENHRFTVYLVRDGEELTLGSLAEPNVGLSYRLQTNLEEYDLGGQLFWQVRLEDLNGKSLRVSQLRPLVVPVE